jgi:plastocyanin
MQSSFLSDPHRPRLLALVVGLALVGATLPAVAIAQSDQPSVNMIEPSATDIMNWGFDSPDLSVSAGQTVVWTNTGAQPHTVTADDNASFDSGLVDPGNTFSLEFDNPGVYAYHCTPHPWMKATITVTS